MLTKQEVRERVVLTYSDDEIITSKKGVYWNPKNGKFANNGEQINRVLLIIGKNPEKTDDEITLAASLMKVQLRKERNEKHKFFNVEEMKFVKNPFDEVKATKENTEKKEA